MSWYNTLIINVIIQIGENNIKNINCVTFVVTLMMSSFSSNLFSDRKMLSAYGVKLNILV